MITIVVPVYNEGKNISKLLDQLSEIITNPIEVLIVYDFEEDNTLPVIREITPELPFPVRTVKNDLGRGVLNAIRTGLSESKTNATLVTMADLSDDFDVVDEMFSKINDGYDVVCGSRYVRGGKQIGGPFLKKTMSRLAGVSLHYLIGIPTHDISNSFKMYSRRVIDTIKIESDGGFEIGTEIVIKSYLNGYSVTEIPCRWWDREEGESRFELKKWLPKYLKWYWYGIRSSWFGRKHEQKPSATELTVKESNSAQKGSSI